MAGLLTYPILLCLLRTKGVPMTYYKRLDFWDLQQRVLFRIFTGFPFIPIL